MASIQKRADGKYRARYRDHDGKEHAKHFRRKIDAQQWLDEITTSLTTGTYVAPGLAKITFRQWSEQWLEGYATRRQGTVRTAKWHVNVLTEHFGDRRLGSIKPSDVKSMNTALGERYNDRSRYAIYRRLGQIMADAVHDGLIPRSPVSRRTSPGAATQREFFPTSEQVGKVLTAMPENFRPAVLLGAYAGLRIAEVAALRIGDVDFMRGVITPAIQYPDKPLKTECSKAPIPIPNELALELGYSSRMFKEPTTVVTSDTGKPVAPWTIQQAWREAKASADLPDAFRFQDLRHYYATMLIDAGLSVKAVQQRMRHASATTTLNVYSHLFKDEDDAAREAVGTDLKNLADYVRTNSA